MYKLHFMHYITITQLHEIALKYFMQVSEENNAQEKLINYYFTFIKMFFLFSLQIAFETSRLHSFIIKRIFKSNKLFITNYYNDFRYTCVCLKHKQRTPRAKNLCK